ncbi:chondroitin sulfate proteoglycan 5-like isoform X3 [Brienomyrus brachyistius]|uniref:chondroitin sulfate proteoglycan 5-like isoform X3 n=1 Tax=Brienomyrus brachyistius TaxID=42636 RepID=UPI0020B36461|nr:chondroitin sulfate proteoglycan 5-like isoform X3 [Brienomyrus brachyistius]
MKSSMDGRQTWVFSGYRGLLMLSASLVLHLMAFCAHGSSIRTNDTEAPNRLNSSSASPPSGQQMDLTLGVAGSAPPIAPLHKPQGSSDLGSGISQDSAELDQVLDAGVNTLFLPPPRPGIGTKVKLDFQDMDEHQHQQHTDPPWLAARPGPVVTATVTPTTAATSAMLDLDLQPATTAVTEPPGQSPTQPDVVTVEFWDLGSHHRHLETDSITESAANQLQAGGTTSWAMFDNYDYLTPSDLLDEKNEVLTDTSDSTTVEDQDIMISTTTSSSFDYHAVSSTVPDDAMISGPHEDEQPPPAPGLVDSVNGSGCGPGYTRHNATCRSLCDFLPSYCFNGGQCYLVEGTGAFCRCSVQDYIWHKGSRCESVVTEFQVMCMAVGVAALTVLLLFMVTVCFAKKLHLLKMENRKLRRRSSKYRPASEQHNDNFSLSTIAEGSHPNKTMNRYTWECKTKEEPDGEPYGVLLPSVQSPAQCLHGDHMKYSHLGDVHTETQAILTSTDDPNAQNKLEDPVKVPPPKEDESLNIQNSLTPKHENNKVVGEEDSAEVNSLQNNMM